jgi:hypothetical protein
MFLIDTHQIQITGLKIEKYLPAISFIPYNVTSLSQLILLKQKSNSISKPCPALNYPELNINPEKPPQWRFFIALRFQICLYYSVSRQFTQSTPQAIPVPVEV